MAGLYDKQAAIYLDARPRYPSEWFSMLASLTPDHSLAWDAGTGNGQAAIDVSDHYKQVIATDISEEQLKHAIQHPQVQYFHSPSSMSEDELVNLVGGENSVDLVIAATAVHWFDLEKFYPVVKRVLKKPGGVVAVWSYNVMQVIPEMDPLLKKFRESTFPFQNPKVMYAYECYKTLPFPFESVGVGCEGKPLELDMPREMSFERLLKLLSSASAVNTAKEQGSELCAPQDPLECVTDSFDGFISTNELSILEDFGDFFGKSEEEIKTTPSGDFEPGTTKKKPRSKRRLKQGAWSMKDFVLSALENHEFPKRICTHCQTDNTPQWRIGPMGPKTLCNACGVRYSTGRLFPEYRPAASPSFDQNKHSNFHKQILRRRANLIH